MGTQCLGQRYTRHRGRLTGSLNCLRFSPISRALLKEQMTKDAEQIRAGSRSLSVKCLPGIGTDCASWDTTHNILFLPFRVMRNVLPHSCMRLATKWSRPTWMRLRTRPILPTTLGGQRQSNMTSMTGSQLCWQSGSRRQHWRADTVFSLHRCIDKDFCPFEY